MSQFCGSLGESSSRCGVTCAAAERQISSPAINSRTAQLVRFITTSASHRCLEQSPQTEPTTRTTCATCCYLGSANKRRCPADPCPAAFSHRTLALTIRGSYRTSAASLSQHDEPARPCPSSAATSC